MKKGVKYKNKITYRAAVNLALQARGYDSGTSYLIVTRYLSLIDGQYILDTPAGIVADRLNGIMQHG